jgi:2-methylfumaryl-CoA isomerase
MGEAELLHQDRPSIGNDLYGAFGRDFGTSDGGRIMVAAISINQWDALVQACGIADAIAALEQRLGLEFRDEAQRFEARTEIAALVEPWFAARTRAQAEAELTRHKVCWGRYNTITELLAADVRASVANPVFERIDTPGIGTHLAAGAVVRAAGIPRQPTSPAPLLGTDTDQVLHEVLGLDSGVIGRLHDAGIVAGPERDPSRV